MARIRLMAPGDVADVATLFEQMQIHYGVPCPPRAEVLEKIARLPDGVCIFVAVEARVVGFAAVGRIFPGPGLNPGLFMKELFVSARARRRRVGTELLRAVARYAVDHGFSRVDWTADRGDVLLLRFYAGIGAVEQPEKAFLRLTGAALDDLAAADADRTSS